MNNKQKGVTFSHFTSTELEQCYEGFQCYSRKCYNKVYKTQITSAAQLQYMFRFIQRGQIKPKHLIFSFTNESYVCI